MHNELAGFLVLKMSDKFTRLVQLWKLTKNTKVKTVEGKGDLDNCSSENTVKSDLTLLMLPSTCKTVTFTLQDCYYVPFIVHDC